MAAASTEASVAVGPGGAMCGGGARVCSSCVDRSAACGGDFGSGGGGVSGALFEAGRSEIVEPRRAECEGGDVRSGGNAEAADAANPLRAPSDSLGGME